jgi:hypothetical protein
LLEPRFQPAVGALVELGGQRRRSGRRLGQSQPPCPCRREPLSRRRSSRYRVAALYTDYLCSVAQASRAYATNNADPATM